MAILVGAAIVAQSAKPAASKMTEAANAFLASLPGDLKSKAAFTYDDPGRLKWFFTPQQDKAKNPTRKGLRMEEMTAKQKAAALELLRTGLSAKGFEQASTIMSLEGLLAELEGKSGSMVRNPNWYFVSIFGEPSNTGKWGWRIEGHHLSVNFTLDKGEVVAVSPIVLAANPAIVKGGSRNGLRALPEIETIAKELIDSLNEEQAKVSRQAKQLPEIKEGRPDADVGDPIGLPAGKLTASQKQILWKLVEAYANRLPQELANTELKRVKDSGADKIHFAYCIEETKPGKPYTYRVHGPTFVVEFLNVQGDSARNPANHIHSGWRALPSDFALKAP